MSYKDARVTKLWSHDHIYNIIWVTWSNFVGGVMDSNYDVITFILEYFILKRLRLTNFADIIKIATLFIKILIKNSNKIKRVINYTLKYDLYLYF